jgi:hypothetical protein
MSDTDDIIPPFSVVRLLRFDDKTSDWKDQIRREFRIGYYSEQDGLDCVWLVNDKGEYEQTVDQKLLYDYFEIVSRSEECDLYGKNRTAILPLNKGELKMFDTSKMVASYEELDDFSKKMIDFVNSSFENKKEWMDFYYQNSPVVAISMDMAKRSGLNEVETLQLCVFALCEKKVLDIMKKLKEIE